jgi:hypothetical protein
MGSTIGGNLQDVKVLDILMFKRAKHSPSPLAANPHLWEFGLFSLYLF